MKTQILIAGLTLALMAESPGLRAADAKAELDKTVAALDKAGLKPEGHARLLEGISKDTGVPVKTLTEQREKTKLGFGGLFIANALAKETGKTFDQIVGLHKDGRGWGQIANDNNVKLGAIVSQAKRAEQAAGRAKNTDKPAGSGKSDNVSDGNKPDNQREVGKHDSELGKKPATPTKPRTTPRGGGGGGKGK